MSNQKVNVIGQVELNVVLNGLSPSLSKRMKLYVVKDMKHSMLFGIDLIKECGMTVDVQTCTIKADKFNFQYSTNGTHPVETRLGVKSG